MDSQYYDEKQVARPVKYELIWKDIWKEVPYLECPCKVDQDIRSEVDL